MIVDVVVDGSVYPGLVAGNKLSATAAAWLQLTVEGIAVCGVRSSQSSGS